MGDKNPKKMKKKKKIAQKATVQPTIAAEISPATKHKKYE